jgi:acetate kinase
LNATRVGDLDAFELLYMMEKENLTIEETRNMLINNGGVKGISGISGDFRDIEKAMLAGNERAEIAFKSFAYYVKRYIGEYLAVLNGADFIVFTGGLGQNSPLMRQQILRNMEGLGVVLDHEKNKNILNEGIISSDDSKIKILVVPTNEELIVARAVREFLENL